jgi:PAS domain S-box-containing protein
VKSTRAAPTRNGGGQSRNYEATMTEPIARDDMPKLDAADSLPLHGARSMRRSEDRLLFSLAVANVGTWDWDIETNRVQWSDNMEEVHNQPRGTFGGTFEGFLQDVYPDDKDEVQRRIQESIATGGDYHVEYRYPRPDGGVTWLEGRGRVLYGKDGQAVRMMGVCTDVSKRKESELEILRLNENLERRIAERTAELQSLNENLVGLISERKRSEQILRLLSQRLMSLQDEERRRFARELHDSVGQYLAAIQMQIGAMEPHVSPRNDEILAECSQTLTRCIEELRTLSYLLHPPLLDETGLVSALSWYIEGFNSRSGINVALEIGAGIPRLPRTVEMVFFRIVQEALTNIHRHSESREAQVKITVEPNVAQLEVSDQGKGIDPERLKQFQETGQGLGVGVTSMRERVSELGGSLELISGSGGTTIRATVRSAGGFEVAPR